ncbi:hypothetical protein LOC68_25375 [Blastopirellula sp. JC732]|uniref:Uncharacterized protein n=1 Tax=Blastopirellula sediminis TaxID=2894196 RepID=A0A9X1MS41_9BACT|nr:hypothetical protein [Blastopirellula sediminis]MCC9604959.1 hypothetical protein [Blastopirellula sediminis]MCC9631741.1 hypothetical protein [Blastopirellula sediminis]
MKFRSTNYGIAYGILLLAATNIGCVPGLYTHSSGDTSLAGIMSGPPAGSRRKRHVLDEQEEVVASASREIDEVTAEQEQLPPDFLARVQSLSLPETEKAAIIRQFNGSSPEELERVLGILETQFASAKPPEEKKPAETQLAAKPATTPQQTAASNDQLAALLDQMKQRVGQARGDVPQRLPTAEGTSAADLPTAEQIAEYARTGNPNFTQYEFTRRDQPAHAQPAATAYPVQQVSHVEPLPTAEEAVLQGAHPDQMEDQRTGVVSNVPPTAIPPTANQAKADMPKSSPAAVQPLSADQQLVMEAIWNRGHVSLEDIFNQLNKHALPAKSSDSADGGRSSDHVAAPPALTLDELQSIIFDLEDAGWVAHRRDDKRILYWSERDRPAGTSQDWDSALRQAIAAMEMSLRNSQLTDAERQTKEIHLRMLYLIAERKGEAMRKIEALPAPEQEFWSNLLFAASDFAHNSEIPVDRRSLLALRSLQEATASLSELCPLDLRNVTFVRNVKGFGDFTPFEKTSFTPGEELLVYLEIENLTSKEVDGQFESTWGASYEIFNDTGRRVDARTFPEYKDRCANRRRDLSFTYRLYLPEGIPPGRYRLELSVRDKETDKFGQASLDFEIKPQQ